MLLFSILAAAIAPGIALLIFLYLRDKYDAEPVHMVVRMFVLGVLIVVPIMVVQRGISMWSGNSSFVLAFVEAAGVEEFVKWFVFYHVIYNHTEFDEPYDGIIYAASISLGFATLENVLYAIYTPVTMGDLLIRALLPVSGHGLFGITMGYYFGKARFAPHGRKLRYLAYSLALPLFLHGLYDWIMLATRSYWLWFIVPFMALLWAFGLNRMKRATLRSPLRLLIREEKMKL